MVALGEAYLEPAEELLRQYERSGDERAFEQIVQRHRGLVYAVCQRIMRNNHDAEDATQAVFLTLAMQVRGGTQIQSLPGWLSQVAHRVSLDMYKSRKRRQAREDIRRQQTIDRYEPEESRDLDQTDLRETLRKQLNELPAKYRTPMVLYYFGGLAPEAIAKELGMKKKTLGVRLFRARKLLAEQLASRGLTAASCAAVMFALSDVVKQGLWNPSFAGHAGSSVATASAGQGLGVDHLSGTILAMSRALGRMAFGSRVRFAMVLLVALSSAMAGYASLTRTLPSVDFSNLKQMAPTFDGVMEDIFGSVPRMLGGVKLGDASQDQSANPQPKPMLAMGHAVEPRLAPPVAVSTKVPTTITPTVSAPLATKAIPAVSAPVTAPTAIAATSARPRVEERPLPSPVQRTWQNPSPTISLASRGSNPPNLLPAIATPTAEPVVEDSTGRAGLIAASDPVDSPLLPEIGQIDGTVSFAGIDANSPIDPIDTVGTFVQDDIVSVALLPDVIDDGGSFGIAGEDGSFINAGTLILPDATVRQPVNTPEPTAALLLLGAAGLLARRTRRTRGIA